MDLVQIMKAIGDETRIRILNLLRKGELCVCEIENILDITQSNASRHLTKLKTTKLIDSEKKAQWVYYKMDQRTLEQYPFVQALLDQELDKIKLLNEDLNRLRQYKDSGITCEVLRENGFEFKCKGE